MQIEFYKLLYTFAVGLPIGFLTAIIWSLLEKRLFIQKAKIDAEHILQEAHEKADTFFEKIKQDFIGYQKRKIRPFEKEIEKKELRIKELQEKVDQTAHKCDLKKKQKTALLNQIKKQIQNIQQIKAQFIEEKESFNKDLKKSLQENIQKIISHFSINTQNLKNQIKEDIEQEWKNKIKAELDKKNKHNTENLQKDCYFYLNTTLNRFERTYCPERGIKPVSFRSHKELNKIFDQDKKFLNQIEKECGVDILVHPEDLTASVFGIDPVRRELGRITLNTLSKKNKIDSRAIKKTTKQSKKNLFAKIHKNGKAICKKLNLKNIAPEVKNMMGALMYRYSFAQNQYFHCEEVGWLCGLLNAELNLPLKDAQRAGLFHDIGKAMDHSIEGSHAVIGAEFLSKYKENSDILHAVRAHHHDEAPSTALAYLVISADAISGSRPGARRFTEDSYNQKMANLERIIDSFENIEDAYIMNAGREMRVIVNNKKVSDEQALNLSKQIARKIEKECSYPGLIKVTLVRHSETVATA